MPRRSAARMTVVPSSTAIRRPSISTVGTPGLLGAQRASAERGVLLELGAVLGDEGARRHGGGVGEGADGGAQHVAGDVQEEVDVARRGLALLEADEHAVEPSRALAAGRARPARLGVEEALEDHERPPHADAVVHHHDAGRAEERARLLDGVHVHRHVDLLGREDRHRGAARDDALQLPSSRDPAGVRIDDLTERRAHRQLVRARADDVPRDAEELRPGALLRADRAEPVRAAQHDVRHAGERLDVVDDGRAAEEPVDGRKGRLDARVGALALERLDEARLLAADVGARAAVYPHLEVEAGAEDVPPEETLRARLGDRLLQHAPAARELAADVDVGGVAADRVRGDDDALEELVGVVLDDLAVLEGARLALVGVDGEIDGLLALLGQEAPLHAGREAGAAPPAEVRGLHHLDQLLGLAGRERLARGRVAAVLEVHVQLTEIRDVPAAEEEELGHYGAAVSAGTGVCFERWIFRCSAMSPSSTPSGRGGQPGTYTSTGMIMSMPGSVV